MPAGSPPTLALAALIPLGAALAFAQAVRAAGVPWSAVLLQAAGLVMLAAATGAACRNRVDPGLIAPAVLVGLIALDARAPWEPILTAAPDTRVNLAWATVIVLAVRVIAMGIGDPAGRSLRRLAAAVAHRAGEHPAGNIGSPHPTYVPQPAWTVLRAPTGVLGAPDPEVAVRLVRLSDPSGRLHL